MLSNKDLKLLMKVKVILEGYNKHGVLEEFSALLEKLQEKKKEHSNKQNNKNKQQREHINLLRNINYNKKRGNFKKVAMYEEQLKNYEKNL